MKKILIFTLILILSCSQAESFVNERDDTQSVSATPSVPPVVSKKDNSAELDILHKELKLVQKQIKENTELLEKLIFLNEDRLIEEKIESGELCDFGECEDNPFSDEITFTISDGDAGRGIFDIENKRPYVKAGTKINYHYVGNSVMLYEDENNELIFIEPDEVIECIPLGWEAKKICSASHPSSYLAYGNNDLKNFYESSGISAPYGTISLELFKCTEPDMCFVDWVNNQSLYKHPEIAQQYGQYNGTAFIQPKIVD